MILMIYTYIVLTVFAGIPVLSFLMTLKALQMGRAYLLDRKVSRRLVFFLIDKDEEVKLGYISRSFSGFRFYCIKKFDNDFIFRDYGIIYKTSQIRKHFIRIASESDFTEQELKNSSNFLTNYLIPPLKDNENDLFNWSKYPKKASYKRQDPVETPATKNPLPT